MLDFLQRKHPKLHRLINETDKFFDRLDGHHIFLLSAGIAFNILLYLIPMFLLAVFVVNLLFEVNMVTKALEKILHDLFPPTEDAKGLIDTIIFEIRHIYSQSSVFGYIGIGVLLWLSSTLLSSFRTGLNAIYGIETPKIFIFYRLRDILLSLILALLILIFSYAIPLTKFVTGLIRQYSPDKTIPIVSNITIIGFSLIISFIFFYLLFRFVPNKRVPRLPRIISTIISVTAIEISRNVFGWYLTTLSNYGRFYGAYAVLVSMALWIYYFSFIILASAELGKTIYEHRQKKKGAESEF